MNGGELHILGDGFIAGNLKVKGNIENAGIGAAPVGTIIYGDYNGTTPTGYIAGIGQLVNTVDYPNLFALWGYKYGGSGAQFMIPDVRDRYLKASGASRTVGSVQAGQILSHTHTGSTDSAGAHAHNVYTKDIARVDSDYRENTGDSPYYERSDYISYPTDSQGAHTHTITVNATGAATNEVNNIAFQGFFKY